MQLMILYNDDDTENEQEFEDIVFFYEYISFRRYVKERVPITKSLEFCNGIIWIREDAITDEASFSGDATSHRTQ